MARQVQVIINPGAVDDLLSTPEAMAFVEHVAQEGADLAREFTPVGDTGDERDAVVHGPASHDGPGGTASCWFGSSSSVWHLVEFGSVNNPPYAPFRRAVERMGLAYTDARSE